MLFRSAGSAQVIIKQIAGVLARRIVCRAKPGDTLQAGERFGLIRFGSRVEVFIPQDFAIHVRLGQKVKGGETIVAAHTGQPCEPFPVGTSQHGRNAQLK